MNQHQRHASVEEKYFLRHLNKIAPDLPAGFCHALAEYYGWYSLDLPCTDGDLSLAIKKLNSAALDFTGVWEDLFGDNLQNIEPSDAWAFIAPLVSPDQLAKQRKLREDTEYQYSSVTQLALELYDNIEFTSETALIHGDFDPQSNFLKLTDYDEPGPTFLLALAASVTACKWPQMKHGTKERQFEKERETVLVVCSRKANDTSPKWTINAKEYSEIGEIFRTENWEHPKLKLSDGPPPQQRLFVLGKNDRFPPLYEVKNFTKRDYEINYFKGKSTPLNYIRHLRCELGPKRMLNESHCGSIIAGLFNLDTHDMKIKELLLEPVTYRSN